MSDSQKRVKIISRVLSHHFPSPSVPLSHQDPYTLLIAVLLSARCTDLRVNQVTPQLFSKARNPSEMIQLSPQEIASIIRPCGLSPRKSQAIWMLSQILLEKYDGKVPCKREALQSLPGVGRKTASVVLQQAFGKYAFAVDTHIYRCARRWGLSEGKTPLQVERDLCLLFPKEKWGRVHIQMILFGRTFCRAQRHIISDCPICSLL